MLELKRIATEKMGKGVTRKLPDSWIVKEGDKTVMAGTKAQCEWYIKNRELRKAEGGKP